MLLTTSKKHQEEAQLQLILLLDVYSIILLIIIAKMVKVAFWSASDEGPHNQISGSISTTSLCLWSSWELSVVAHPALWARQHLLGPEPCLFNSYIYSTYITPTSNLNIHISIFILSALGHVHRECAYTQSQLPQDNPSLLQQQAFHLQSPPIT